MYSVIYVPASHWRPQTQHVLITKKAYRLQYLSDSNLNEEQHSQSVHDEIGELILVSNQLYQ